MFGFSVVNALGRIVINGDTPILTELGRGSFSVNQAPSYPNGLNYQGKPPSYSGYSIVHYAFKLPLGQWVHISRPAGDNNKPPLLLCPNKISVSFVAFGKTNEVAQSTDSYGFQLYNRNGVLVFDSGIGTFIAEQSKFITVYDTQKFIFNDPYNDNWLMGTCGEVNGFYTDGSGLYNVFTHLAIRRSSNGDYHVKTIPAFEVGVVEEGGRFRQTTISPVLVRVV